MVEPGAGDEVYTLAIAGSQVPGDGGAEVALTQFFEVREWIEHIEAQDRHIEEQARALDEMDAWRRERLEALELLAERENAVAELQAIRGRLERRSRVRPRRAKCVSFRRGWTACSVRAAGSWPPRCAPRHGVPSPVAPGSSLGRLHARHQLGVGLDDQRERLGGGDVRERQHRVASHAVAGEDLRHADRERPRVAIRHHRSKSSQPCRRWSTVYPPRWSRSSDVRIIAIASM